jgi:hypothetical protein
MLRRENVKDLDCMGGHFETAIQEIRSTDMDWVSPTQDRD